MKKRFTNRFFGMAMSLVMLFSSIPATAMAEDYSIMPLGTVYHSDQMLETQNSYRIPFLLFNGQEDIANFAPTQVAWTNPANEVVYQAYCINPAYSGYGDVPDYGIDIEKFDNDCIVDAGGSGGAGKTAGSASSAGNTVAAFLEGAVNYGFPTVDAATLLGGSASSYGVSQEELDYAAYLATKLAIWSGIHNSYSINSWSENTSVPYPSALRRAVLAATKDIYDKAGRHTPHDGESDVTFTAGEPTKSGSNYEVVYTIDNTDNNVPGSEMYIEMAAGGSFPDGLTIVDENGDEFETKTTSSGNERYVLPDGTEEVTVIVPDPGADGTQIDLRLYAQQMKKVLLYGRSTKDATQSYVLAGNHYDNPTDGFAINQEYEELPDDPTGDTDTPNDDTSGTADLTVIKLDARDHATPLAGVTFDCYNSRGQLIDTGTTNSRGKWEPNIPGEGTYTIVERDSGDSYQLTEPTTLVVTVDDDPVTATFRDYPDQTVTMEKEDAETGDPISGVQYEIVQIDGKGAWRATGKTNSSGKIEWENVTDGTYLVREVSTVEGYILDQTPQYVTVRNGQAPSLKFTNSKYPGLTITKVDKQTGESISDPATFKVEQIDGSYSTTVETKGGTVNLKNLPVGSYKITELAAPEGYVVDSCPGTVYLGEDKSIQYTAYNLKAPVLTIEKIDKQTGDAVPGTKFEVKKADGTKIGTVETGNDGTVTVGMKGSDLGYLEPGTYTVTEVFVPEPYVLSGEHQDIQLNAGDTKSLMFANLEAPTITVQKYDEETGERMEGAQFAIYEQSDLSRPVAEGMTDKDGEFTTGYIAPGTYVVTELNPPPGYMFSDKTSPDRVIVAKAGDGEIIVKVDNIKLPELTIKKIDAVTKEPIPGVTYKIALVDDTSVQPATVTTDEDGIISLPGLTAGTYEITEISTPHPYILNDTPQRVKLEGGDTKTLLFENIKLPTLLIQKTDATTNKGIANTTYKIEYEQADGSTKTIGTYKTDANGQIKLPYVQPGWYVITETIPAQGYQKPTNPVTRVYLDAGDNSYLSTEDIIGSTATGGITNAGNSTTGTTTSGIEITSGKDYPVVGDIVNYPLNSLIIKKSDANTGEMLDGATFEVIKLTAETSGQNGKVICTVTTDHSGVIVITGLEAGAYAVRETKAPANYIIAETDLQTVNLKADGTSVVEVVFRNYPYGSLLITKVDELTNKPLAGARFKVTTSDGTVVGNDNGEYISNTNGEILIPNLEPGSYVVTELEAPEGYVRDNIPQTVKIGTDEGTYRLKFTNKPLSGIKIIKTDSETDAPLEGVKFSVSKLNGEKIDTFTTDNEGMIYVSGLEDGWYTVTETKGLEGYHWDEEPKTVEVKAGKVALVEVENQPYSCLVIEKTSSKNDRPIEGVEFLVTKLNGEQIGYYETDESGLIVIEGLEEGTYLVKETEAAEGYLLDSEAREVQIKDGERTTLKIENDPLASILIHKIDSVTGDGIEGVTFILYDADNDPIGQFVTDDEGYIHIEDELEEGKYKLREIEPADGYMEDNKARTVYVKKGKTTEVEWENTPQLGQIKIKKISGDYNETNALPKGTALEGAIFEIYNYKTGNVVDRIETDYYGVANSKPLPIGRYIVKEVQAPDFYKINPEEIDVTVEFATQVVNITVENYSANISAEINKFGPYEVMPGQSAIYTIKNVRNSSTVPLTDFYWRDVIPTAAGTLDKIVTGTYNLQGRYKVVATTSYGNTIVLADNLDTARNNVIQCAPAAVGLNNGEYITSFSLMFGTVQPGFTQVQDAKVYLKVKNTNLPNGYVFANKADVGGRYGNEWATSNSTWTTTVYNPAAVKLPKTGW